MASLREMKWIYNRNDQKLDYSSNADLTETAHIILFNIS